MQGRIEQFKKMAEADPQNEMGHFSLGKAYFEAGEFANAIGPLKRTLELNPTYSKAYQLLGEAQASKGDKDAALATLMTGFKVADERGDRMPRDGIAQLIKKLGGTPPMSASTAAQPAPAAAAAEGTELNCSRCGRPTARMPERPFKGSLGEAVWANVCAGCWREWIGMGTKVINEMGLQLADPRAQKIYDEQMVEFLQLPE